MAKIQYQFKRDERLKFLSHLDQQRLFQRAFRRAGIKLAYSQGFNPHPKMSFALAMSVGLTSDCEYGEVTIEQDMDLKNFVKQMNESLPPGLEIVQARICDEKEPSLSSQLEKSKYQVSVKYLESGTVESISSIIERYLKQNSIQIEKRNKRGKKVLKEIRPLIGRIEVDKLLESVVILNIDVLYIDQQTVKPELILTNINEFEGEIFVIDPSIQIHRKNLILKNGF